MLCTTTFFKNFDRVPENENNERKNSRCLLVLLLLFSVFSKLKSCWFRSLLKSLHLLSPDNMHLNNSESQLVKEKRAYSPTHKVLAHV